MDAKALWNQLVMERVSEILKDGSSEERDLEEMQEMFTEILNEEQNKKYDELCDRQIRKMILEQNMIYQQGLFDGLYFGHKIFVE